MRSGPAKTLPALTKKLVSILHFARFGSAELFASLHLHGGLFVKTEKKKTALYLLLNTVILIALYYAIPTWTHFMYLPHIYILAGAGLGLYYVIYNRGFVGKNATPESLPDSMSPLEKQKYIEESRERMQKSKWVLTLLLPIIVTILIDMLYIFFISEWFV
jgi:hypothetical protein